MKDFFIPLKGNLGEWSSRILRIAAYLISIIGLLFFNYDGIDILWIFTVHLMAVSFVGLVKIVSAQRADVFQWWIFPRFLIGIFGFLLYTYPIIWLMEDVFHYNVVKVGATPLGWIQITAIALGQLTVLINWFKKKTYLERNFVFELFWHSAYFFGVYRLLNFGVTYFASYSLNFTEQKIAALLVVIIRLLSEIAFNFLNRLLVKWLQPPEEKQRFVR